VGMRTTTETHINLDAALASLTTDKVLKVGWPEKIRYKEEEGGEFVAAIAAQNEYGAPHLHIPARPFLGPAISTNKTAWLDQVRRGAKRAIRGETTVLDILDDLGQRASGDVAKAIKAVTSPPLSPITIERRAARYTSKTNKTNAKTLSKPLVDTGLMLASVTYLVENE